MLLRLLFVLNKNVNFLYKVYCWFDQILNSLLCKSKKILGDSVHLANSSVKCNHYTHVLMAHWQEPDFSF